MTTTAHPLVDDYLNRLRSAARNLSPQDRDELVAEIRSHVESGLPGEPGEADVRNLLNDLGPPEDIVAAARPAQPPPRDPDAANPWGVLEIAAVLALTLGAVLLPVLAPMVGAALAWASPRWSVREKIVATVLVLAAPVVLLTGLMIGDT